MEDKKADTAARDKLKGEAVLSVVFMIVSIGVMMESVSMSRIIYERTGAEFYTLPGVFPFIVALLIFCCSTAVSVNVYKKGIRPKLPTLKKMKGFFSSNETVILLTVILWMLFYVSVMILFLPFELATFIFLAFLMIVFKSASLWKSLLISLLFSVIVVAFFSIIVKTPFPHTFF